MGDAPLNIRLFMHDLVSFLEAKNNAGTSTISPRFADTSSIIIHERVSDNLTPPSLRKWCKWH